MLMIFAPFLWGIVFTDVRAKNVMGAVRFNELRNSAGVIQSGARNTLPAMMVAAVSTLHSKPVCDGNVESCPHKVVAILRSHLRTQTDFAVRHISVYDIQMECLYSPLVSYGVCQAEAE
jgi:hypothetical protein